MREEVELLHHQYRAHTYCTINEASSLRRHRRQDCAKLRPQRIQLVPKGFRLARHTKPSKTLYVLRFWSKRETVNPANDLFSKPIQLGSDAMERL